MARYHALIGHEVEVYYWCGNLLKPTRGILAADSGKFIFLEEELHRVSAVRQEISYRSIVSVTESAATPPSPPAA